MKFCIKYFNPVSVLIMTILFASQLPSVRAVDNESALPILNADSPIENYMQYAALNNPGLKAAFEEWKATIEKSRQAGVLPDPRFNYGYYIESVETRLGPQENKFGLSQTFPWWGKRKLQSGMVDDEAKIKKELFDKKRLSLFYKVKSIYAEYWFLAREVEITREHIKLLSDMEAVARTRYKNGAAPYSSVIQLQVEQGKYADKLSTFLALRKPLSVKFNAVLNRSADSLLPFPKALPDNSAEINDKLVREEMLNFNQDIKRYSFLMEKEEKNIRLAKKQNYPDLTFGVDYIQTGDAIDPSLPDSGQDAVMATVAINIPIWRGKYKAAEKEAQLRKSQYINARTNTINELNADMALALYYYHDASRKINLYRDTLVPKAEQALNAAQQEFRTGKTSYISLIDTARKLLEFKLSAKRAEADSLIRLAEIERLTGNINNVYNNKTKGE